MYSSDRNAPPVRSQTSVSAWSRALLVALLLTAPHFALSVGAAGATRQPSRLGLRPPQPPPTWNGSPEDVQRVIQEVSVDLAKIGTLAPQDCNFTSVFLRMVHAEDRINAVRGPIDFYQRISPNSLPMTIKARGSTKEFTSASSGLKTILNAEKNIKASGEWEALSKEDKRLVEKKVLQIRRLGLALPDKESDEFGALKAELFRISSEFAANLRRENGVVSFTRPELAGVPMDALSGYNQRGEGLNATYDVPFKKLDLDPIFQYAENPATRKRAFHAHKARLAHNIPLLDKAVELRRRMAKVLGHNTWADYATEISMLRNPKNVNAFLDDLESRLRPLALKEREILLAMKRTEHNEKGLPFDGEFYGWDLDYYARKYTEKTFTVNATLVKEYFPVSVVIPAILRIYEDLFSVRFEEMKGSPTWHKDVQHFAVWRKNATDPLGFLGYCYLDLFSREFKPSEAAMVPVLPGYTKPDGTRSYPAAVLMADLAKAAPNKPALMGHSDVVVFFHEMGHVFHSLLSRTKYSMFHGSRVAHEFKEAPSQMLEQWGWEPEVLKKISSHYQTKKPLPAELIDGIIKSRYVNVGFTEIKDIMYAKFDMRLHTATESVNSTELWNSLRKKIIPWKSDKPDLMHGSFTHIMHGYEAGYYGYAYSRVLASDMYATVFKGSPLDPIRGAKFVNAILQPGGSRDELESLEDFLGRPSNNEAFKKELAGAPTSD